MDTETKIYMNEGVPFNTSGAANVFLNIDKCKKVKSADGNSIRLNTVATTDHGIHIHTTFPIASSKKIKLLFTLNLLLSVVSMIISGCIAFFYFGDVQNNVATLHYDLTTIQKVPESLVVHFTGAYKRDMGNEKYIGPWLRDEKISSKNSDKQIEVHGNAVTINEDGLYLIYTQLVYQTKLPTSYFIWVRGEGDEQPKQLTTCATGDISPEWPQNKLSCSVQIVARLYRNDTVSVAQREPNRTVLLELGYSYLGFVKLSS